MILSSKASNHRTSSGVHIIGPSSFHLPWPFSNLASHSYNSIEKVQKKILCIFIYKYLSNHYSFDRHGFLFSCIANSWIFLSSYFSISFFVGFQWCNITHLLQAYLGPRNGTIFWLRGSWPRFRFSCAN